MLLRNFLLFVSLNFSAVAFSQQIAINNTASLSGRSGYYNWTVFVAADDATLNSIDHVDYLLHPTFPNPQVSSNNRSSKFSYSSTGWGEFEIKVKIVFKNGRAPEYISYWLRLQSKISKPMLRSVRPVFKK